jgi:peptide/nickel transport system ATP-binding protein
VRLLGQPWSGVSEAARRPLRPRLQYIPQDPLSSFDPRYRVSQVIAENLQGLPRAETGARIAALLQQVGLAPELAERFPRSLSGGQRQRVAIARALAAQPALIVCDEPVSALDVSVQAQVIDLIAELQSRLGTALLFISHDINLVRHVADRVLVLNRGRLVEQGPVEEVLSRPAHEYTRSLLAAVPEPLAA